MMTFLETPQFIFNANNSIYRINDTAGTIHISNYKPSSSCMWIIEGDAEGALHLNLVQFQTECAWDHLYVYDGDGVNDNLIAALR